MSLPTSGLSTALYHSQLVIALTSCHSTGQKPEHCTFCSFKTSDPGSLTRHKKRLHNYESQRERAKKRASVPAPVTAPVESPSSFPAPRPVSAPPAQLAFSCPRSPSEDSMDCRSSDMTDDEDDEDDIRYASSGESSRESTPHSPHSSVSGYYGYETSPAFDYRARSSSPLMQYALYGTDHSATSARLSFVRGTSTGGAGAQSPQRDGSPVSHYSTSDTEVSFCRTASSGSYPGAQSSYRYVSPGPQYLTTPGPRLSFSTTVSSGFIPRTQSLPSYPQNSSSIVRTPLGAYRIISRDYSGRPIPKIYVPA